MIEDIAYINALIHRAEEEGARTVPVNTKELKEICRAAESNFAKFQVQFVGKHAGWIRINELRKLRLGQKRHIQCAMKKGDGYEVEIFFKANLRDLEQSRVDVVAETA